MIRQACRRFLDILRDARERSRPEGHETHLLSEIENAGWATAFVPRDVAVSLVPRKVAVWNTDAARTYRCGVCGSPVFSQYEGDIPPAIACEPSGHRLIWECER